MRVAVPLLSVLAVVALAGGPGWAQDEPAAEGAATEADPAETTTAEAAPVPAPAELIASAESAAPEHISKEATIYDGQMNTLREGTNGWWCMPNDPNTPGPDQMCGDANAMEWLMALIEQRDPPEGKVGIGYSLMGAAVTSNATPYADPPANEEDWIWAPPHIAIFNDPAAMEGYPHEPDPDVTKPFVMWYDTPYAHLMLPTAGLE